MKKLMWTFVVLSVVAFAAPVLAAPPAVPADGIKLDNTKLQVVFNHSTHKTADCVTCHHPVDGKENYQKCSTAGCHDVFDRKDKSAHSYYRVMHAKGLKYDSCVSCHADFVKDHPDQKKELTACKKSKCHP